MATDANIEFTGTYPADVKEPGLVGVNGRNFVDLVRRLPAGELRIRLDDATGTVILEQAAVPINFPPIDPTWFQSLAPFSSEGAVVWSGDFFQEIIDRVFFCVSDDESSDASRASTSSPLAKAYRSVRPERPSVRPDPLHARRSVRPPSRRRCADPAKCGELRKWLGGDEIEVNLTDKRLFVRSGDGHETLSLPRAGYAYPDYSPFMTRLASPDVSLLKLSRKDCLDALDRISIFNTESDRCTYFELSSAEAMLSAQGQDTGSANESLEVSYNGSIGRIAFPTKNLMEILTHYQSGELTLTLTGAEGPCGINGTEDPDYTVLIMPMKIAEESYYEEN